MGSSEALGAKLEPSKERGVFCPVLTVAPFSLPTKCPFVRIRAKRWTEATPPPPTNPNPGVGQEAEGLGAGMCLHGPEMAQILSAIPGHVPHPPELFAWGSVCTQVLLPSPGKSLGWLIASHGLGPAPVLTPVFPGCADSRECPGWLVPPHSH